MPFSAVHLLCVFPQKVPFCTSQHSQVMLEQNVWRAFLDRHNPGWQVCKAALRHDWALQNRNGRQEQTNHCFGSHTFSETNGGSIQTKKIFLKRSGRKATSATKKIPFCFWKLFVTSNFSSFFEIIKISRAQWRVIRYVSFWNKSGLQACQSLAACLSF